MKLPPPHLDELKRDFFQENHSERNEFVKNSALKEFCMMRCEDRKRKHTAPIYIYVYVYIYISSKYVSFEYEYVLLCLGIHVETHIIDFPDSAFEKPCHSHKTPHCVGGFHGPHRTASRSGTVRKQSVDGLGIPT